MLPLHHERPLPLRNLFGFMRWIRSEILVFELATAAESGSAGKGLSSTWQTVPGAGSVPLAKYARVDLIVQFEVSAVEVCYRR